MHKTKGPWGEKSVDSSGLKRKILAPSFHRLIDTSLVMGEVVVSIWLAQMRGWKVASLECLACS